MQLSDRGGGGGVVILACDGLASGVGGASDCEGVGGGGGGHVELPMQPSDCRGGVVVRDCWVVGGNVQPVIFMQPVVFLAEVIGGGGTTKSGIGVVGLVESGRGGSVKFSGGLRCKAGLGVGFVRELSSGDLLLHNSVNFSCSRCILLLLGLCDGCVG